MKEGAAPEVPPQNSQGHRPRRWPLIVGATGAGAAVLAFGLWNLRIPIADQIIRSNLVQRNIDADFRIEKLNFSTAELAAVRLGPEETPDAAIASAEIRYHWAGLAPQIEQITLREPRLRMSLDRSGRLNTGQLGRLVATDEDASDEAEKPQIPRIGLVVEDGSLLLQTPAGAAPIRFSASGVLGRDFSALAELEADIARDSASDTPARMQGVRAQLRIDTDQAREGALTAQLEASADALGWAGAMVQGARLEAQASTDMRLENVDGALSFTVSAFEGEIAGMDVRAQDVSGSARADGALADAGLALGDWSGEFDAQAAHVAQGAEEARSARQVALTSEWSGRGEGPNAHASGGYDLRAASARWDSVRGTGANARGHVMFNVNADESLHANANVTIDAAQLSGAAQRDVITALPSLGGAPVAPLMAELRHATDRALDRFSVSGGVDFLINGLGQRVVVHAPWELQSASGARARIAPLREDRPTLVVQWPGALLHGIVAADIAGGGFPRATLLIDSADWAPDAPLDVDGTITINNWRAGDAALSAREVRTALQVRPDGGGQIDFSGPTRVSGPLGGGLLQNAETELGLRVSWGEGWRVTPAQDCLPMRIGQLDVAGLSFNDGAMRVCAANGAEGALIAANAQGALSGGFDVSGLSLSGVMGGGGQEPATLQSRNVRGRFSGRTSDMRLDIAANTPSLAITFAPERQMVVRGEALTGLARITEGSWTVNGEFRSGSLEDPALPGAVSAIAGQWRAAPTSTDGVVINVEAGEALMVASPVNAPDDPRPLFSPMRLTNARAEMADGRIDATGDIILEDGARGLAHVTAQHDIAAGQGDAQIEAEALVFNDNLQPFELSELLRGVVANVQGAASADAHVRWGNGAIGASGRIGVSDMSLATATIPIIQDVNGEVYFDDLFALTTPPGQTLHIGLVNPGVAVREGVLQFQLLPEGEVSIERAEFAFASGVLSLEPTRIQLGSEETQFTLKLHDVDVAALVTQLNVPDLFATGRVEGEFPLTLSPRSSVITNGVLRASEEGGTIAYTGHAGDGATGPARMAFQALRSFDYDRLSLTLDGDLNGEVVTAIQFSGENSGQGVDVGAQSPLGGEEIRIRGVPFRFNVRVSAPFRRLADTVASVTDARALLNQASEAEEDVDQDASPSP